jgi:hypothetical protein
MFYAAKSGMNALSRTLLTLTAAAALSIAVSNPGLVMRFAEADWGDFTG